MGHIEDQIQDRRIAVEKNWEVVMRFVAVLVVAGLMVLPVETVARTWYITPDGTGDAPTIQAGIDSARAGDVVELADGVFMGAGNRDLTYNNKAITIRSSSGNRENCIIDCQGTADQPHRGFYFSSYLDGPESVLDGVTITNGYVVGYNGEGVGGGILCYAASPTIRNCVLEGNTAWWGGGIGIFWYSSPTIMDCKVVGNSAIEDGGGLTCYSYSPAVVKRCAIEDNVSMGRGGGIFCVWSEALFSDSSMTNNEAHEFGGGIACMYAPSAIIISNLIAGNHTDWNGGGIYIHQSSPQVRKNIIVSNHPAGGSGGGILCSESNGDIEENTIWENPPVSELEGVFCDDSSPVIRRNIISGSNGARAVRCYGSSSPTIECNALWDDIGGDIECGYEEQNIFSHPMFCGDLNYPGDPYRLDIASPCAVRNSPCGQLIGARPAGCSGSVATEPTTWGRVKAMYR